MKCIMDKRPAHFFDKMRRCAMQFSAFGVMLIMTLGLTGNQAALAAASTKTPEIKFGFPEFPPLSFTNSRNEPDGYLFHLSIGLFKRAGIPAQGAIYPARRLFENLANGSIDFSMVVHNPLLDACCLFSKQAAMREELRVYHVSGTVPVKSKNELIGKRIIRLQGFSYAGFIDFINDEKNRITSEIAPNHEAAFAMLDAGRADYVLGYAGPANTGLAIHPVKNLHFEVIDHLDIYLALSKAYPDAEHVLARLTTMVKSMQNEPNFRPPTNN